MAYALLALLGTQNNEVVIISGGREILGKYLIYKINTRGYYTTG